MLLSRHWYSTIPRAKVMIVLRVEQEPEPSPIR